MWGGGCLRSCAPFEARPGRPAIGAAIGALTGWLIADNSLLWQRPRISWSASIFWMAIFGLLGAIWQRSATMHRLGHRQHRSWSVITALVAAALGEPWSV